MVHLWVQCGAPAMISRATTAHVWDVENQLDGAHLNILGLKISTIHSSMGHSFRVDVVAQIADMLYVKSCKYNELYEVRSYRLGKSR